MKPGVYGWHSLPEPRQLARVILQILSSGVDDGRVSVESPDTFTARFSDAELGQTILGSSDAPQPALTTSDDEDSDAAEATSAPLNGEGVGSSRSASSSCRSFQRRGL